MRKSFLGILILLLSVTPWQRLRAEYTVGMRSFLGGNLAFGAVGSNRFVAAPPIIPFITGSDNTALGGELFGELAFIGPLYLEPTFGYLKQKKLFRAEGLEEAKNGGITEKLPNVYVNHLLENISFGLSIKGKTPGITNTLRFSGAFGLQFLYALKSEVSYYTIKNIQKSGKWEESTLAADKSATKVLTGEVNPWGLRVLMGLGMDYYNPKLKGVVLQAEARFGFDLSYLFFKQNNLKSLAEGQGIPDRLRKTYIEFSGGIFLGATYRLPVGDAKNIIPEKEIKRTDFDTEEEE